MKYRILSKLKKPVHTRSYHFLGIVYEMGSVWKVLRIEKIV